MIKVGVVIGRFQVSELHVGHREIISTSIKENDETIILVGTSRRDFDSRDPLSFEIRRKMLKDYTPNISNILPLPDKGDNEEWSNYIDLMLRILYNGEAKVTIYGSRDSFITSGSYKGIHKTKEIQPINSISGSESRNNINLNYFYSLTHNNARNFREGIIYSQNNRRPMNYPTVDMACILDNHLLLARRSSTDLWRFPGGFLSDTDNSLQAAASRELQEETGLIIPKDKFIFVDSARGNDPVRYNDKSKDKIITCLFVAEVSCIKECGVTEARAGDDVKEVKWFNLKEDITPHIIKNHQNLFFFLKRYLEINKNNQLDYRCGGCDGSCGASS